LAVPPPQSLNQGYGFSSEPPRHATFSITRLEFLMGLDPSNLMFAQGVVLEWLSSFSRIDLRCKDIVQPELAWKDVLHDMCDLFMTGLVCVAIEDI